MMSLTAEAAAQQVQDRLKDLQGLIHDIEAERRKNEPNLTSIIRAQEKLVQEDRNALPPAKLKALYKAGMQDTAEEDALIRQALAKIQEIRTIRNERRMQARDAGNKETIRRVALMNMLQISAQTIPLFVSKPGEKVPPLCGAVPAESNYIAKPGDMVAALVKGIEAAENWILAEVVQYLSGQNKYEVDDIDEEDEKERHILSKRKIIPLPLMRVNPETDGHALFPKDTMVMALYPQTTCFYKAIVHQSPQTANDDYELLFEDPTYEEGYSPAVPVSQRYVLAYRPTKKTGGLSST